MKTRKNNLYPIIELSPAEAISNILGPGQPPRQPPLSGRKMYGHETKSSSKISGQQRRRLYKRAEALSAAGKKNDKTLS